MGEKYTNVKRSGLATLMILMGVGMLSIPFTPFAKAQTSTPTLQVTVNSVLTLSVAVPTINFPALTPGTPVSVYSTSTVTTNNATGANFQLNRTSNTSTLALGSDPTVTITDKADWVPGINTTTVGNAATYAAPGLAFRVSVATTSPCMQAATWWGTDGSAKYAGVASSSASNLKVANCGVYQSAGQVVSVSYILDVPTTQKTGAYTGTVTYTALANP
jgi:hypothetical protein